ncbi:glycosyltransferase family 2 protein [Rubrobacter indicoceani]|uniref:glycosyltransferase family 2 protein n=1 Tax=Rubrobacter indicoceani TaxID=2051957 RepID=UPI0013C4C297|nr:glycosyltransferase family 2 protein [Rubrobacter indicoceani]
MISTESTRTENASRTRTALTVIVPAFNEAGSIADTIRSLQGQSAPPEEIMIVDDCSTDGTGEVARSLGVTVIRPPGNTGSKAGAQSFVLGLVRTEFVAAIDADTILAPDGLELLLDALAEDRNTAAACGFVLPRRVRTLWERGRYIEYLFAFTFIKQVQDYFQRPVISSGCFSAYRTELLRGCGGWSGRTMAEDMDLTWTFYQAGYGVRFVPEALCYPLEPQDFGFMRKQLRRWSHGFVQNLRLHWRGIVHVGYLRSVVAVAFWDAALAPLVYFLLLPLLAVFVSPLFLIGYVIDAPAVLVPVLVGAAKRGEVGRALLSYPAFFVLRLVNSAIMFKAIVLELLLKRSLSVYEKGH